MPEKVLTEGWAMPWTARSFHYFVLEEKVKGDRRSFSLCGNYGFFNAPAALNEDGGVENATDCRKCRAKLKKRGDLNGAEPNL